MAQSGWQLFTFNVPVPCPPVAAAHSVHEMAVTVTRPKAHPMVSFAGRTCGVDPGPQESTAGRGTTVVAVEADVEVVDFDVGPLVVETLPSVDFVAGGEDLEPTVKPTAIPAPRASTTSAAMPTRTTVLRRTLITRESFRATSAHGSSRRCGKNRRPRVGHNDRLDARGATPRGLRVSQTETLWTTPEATDGRRSRLPVHRGWHVCVVVSGWPQPVGRRRPGFMHWLESRSSPRVVRMHSRTRDRPHGPLLQPPIAPGLLHAHGKRVFGRTQGPQYGIREAPLSQVLGPIGETTCSAD